MPRFPTFLLISLGFHVLLILSLTLGLRPQVLLTLNRAEIGIVHLDEKLLRAMAQAGSSGGGAVARKPGASGGGSSRSRGPKLSGLGGDLFQKSPLGSFDDSPARETSPNSGSRGLKEGLGNGVGGDGPATGYRSDGGAPALGFGRERAGSRVEGAGERSSGTPSPPSAIQWNSGSAVRRVSSQPELDWPDSLKGKGIRAEVLVSVTVDPSGRVLSPVVQRSSGSGDLDRAVLDAVRRTLFQAAEGSSPSYGTIRYTFKY